MYLTNINLSVNRLTIFYVYDTYTAILTLLHRIENQLVYFLFLLWLSEINADTLKANVSNLHNLICYFLLKNVRDASNSVEFSVVCGININSKLNPPPPGFDNGCIITLIKYHILNTFC